MAEPIRAAADEVIWSEMQAALNAMERCLALGAVVDARLADVERRLDRKRANNGRLEAILDELRGSDR